MNCEELKIDMEGAQRSNAILAYVPRQILFYDAPLAPLSPSLIVLSTCFDFVIIHPNDSAITMNEDMRSVKLLLNLYFIDLDRSTVYKHSDNYNE